MTSAIEVSHLTKRFGDVLALDDLSLHFEENVITGLLGRNGAGKTVLMSLVTDQERPTSGSVRVFGQDPARSADVVGRISFIRDNQRYPEEFKVSHLLSLGPVFHAGWSADLAQRVIETFAIPTNRKIRKMSRGQQSAVAAMVGLASRAPITLFDEPYLGMDATARTQFYDLLLRDYSEHPRTVIMSTHLIDEMEPLLERVIVLDSGRVRREGSVDDLVASAYRLSGPWERLEPFEATALHRSRMGTLGTLLIEGDPRYADTPGLDVSPVSLQELVAAYGLSDHREGAVA